MNKPTENPQRHSRLGFASLGIAVTVPVLLILLFAVAMMLGSAKGPGGYVAPVAVIFALAAPLLHLLGIIFGAVGWFSKQTKNLFPIIGTILNLILGLTGLLILLLVGLQLLYIGGLILH